MALTYGMIGDRLADLVAELREMDDSDIANALGKHFPGYESSYFIDILDNIRAACDALSLKGLTEAIAARDGN